MMSVSLSKIKQSQRLWTLVISCILSFFYFPMLALLNVAMQPFIHQGEQDTAKLMRDCQEIISAHIGIIAPGYALVTVGMALLLGLEAFHYLNDKRQLDFYESLPVRRSTRFGQIIRDSFLIWLIPYVFNLLLACLINLL